MTDFMIPDQYFWRLWKLKHHKLIELTSGKNAGSSKFWFDFMWLPRGTDHAGWYLHVGAFGYFLEFNVYDSRHATEL